MRTAAFLLLAIPLWADSPDSVWVTAGVDSLNMGSEDGPHNHVFVCANTTRDWLYAQRKGLFTPLLARECICRVCLRHEWQRWEAAPKPAPELTEFEKLKAKLAVDSRKMGDDQDTTGWIKVPADVIAVLESGGLFIPDLDLKTAMYTGKQEEILPIYAAQEMPPPMTREIGDLLLFHTSVADPDCVRAMVERLVP